MGALVLLGLRRSRRTAGGSGGGPSGCCGSGRLSNGPTCSAWATRQPMSGGFAARNRAMIVFRMDVWSKTVDDTLPSRTHGLTTNAGTRMP